MQIENLRFYNLSNKELGGKSGIYKLSSGGHIYIGSSKNLYSRLAEHRIDLRDNKHSNEFLQRVYNKNGISDMRIDIVEYCDPEIRLEREKFWIKELNADMNMQDPVDHTLSEESRKKLSKSIRKGLADGKYKKKFDFCEIEAYDYFGNFLEKFSSKEDAAKKYKCTVKDVQRAAGGYKKGLAINGIRFRYSISSVPPQKFKFSSNFIGSHLVFFFINENNEEEYAFSSVKNCWKFFAEHSHMNEIKIIPKLRCQVEGDFPGKRGPSKQNSVNLENSSSKDNPNPSISEME